mgnify:FL=1
MDVNQAAPIQPVGPGGGQGGGGQDGRKKDEHQDEQTPHGHTEPAINVSGLLSMEGLTPEAQHALERMAAEIEPLRHQLIHAQEELEHALEREFQDAVVPALNRRGFIHDLDKLIHRLGQAQSRPSLILVHLANGDDIRRRHGREALDMALRSVCGVLSSDRHQAMVVGALGGNDFALVVLEDGLDGGRRKAAEIETALRETQTARACSWRPGRASRCSSRA